MTWKTIDRIDDNPSVDGATLCRLVAAGRVGAGRFPGRHPRHAAEDVVEYLHNNKRIVNPHSTRRRASLAAMGPAAPASRPTA